MTMLARGRDWSAVVGLVALFGLVAAAPATAKDKGIGWVGLSRNAKVQGVYGRNSYVQGDSKATKLEGTQLWVNFEGGYLGKVSSLGNVGGIEGGIYLGLDGAFSDQDKVATLGSFAYDMHVGFPFTLFHLFSGGVESLQLAVAPGFGFDHMHAYLYIKAKGAYMLTPGITVEGAYTWWPGPTSATAYGPTGLGLNIASARGSVYVSRGDDAPAIELFGEYLWAEEEQEVDGTPVAGDPKAFAGKNPFTQTKRRECCSNLRLGVGLAF